MIRQTARVGAWMLLFLLTFTVGASKERYHLDDFSYLTFEELRGSWIVISYWAIWCPPCKEEADILNSIHQDRHNLNVMVLGVNFDGVQNIQLRDQKKSFGIQYPDLLEDPGSRWNLAKPHFIPRTVIVDKNGRLHKVIDGVISRGEVLANLDAKGV